MSHYEREPGVELDPRHRPRPTPAQDIEPDPHSLLFGQDDAHDAGVPMTRADRRLAERTRASNRRNRRGQRVFIVLAIVIVLAAGIAAAVVVPKLSDWFGTPDYSGAGTGAATVVVDNGDLASDIGATLEHEQVVKSAKAFVDAAAKDPASRNIQPGTYRLHLHMSGQAALTLLLDPASRVASNDVLIKEGYSSMEVEAELVKVLGKDQQPAIAKAIADVADFGFPIGYSAKSGTPTSVEGFLYPATYAVSPGDTPASILQSMKQAFTTYDHDNGFATAAGKLKITPYEALTIASMIESEALHDADRPKVARVILNRLKAGMPLGIDATSIYGALLADPALISKPRQTVADSINFNLTAPYNTRLVPGLPPTPISNPGADSLEAAVNPAAGDWLYYVNGDAEGNLFFTSSPSEFEVAKQKCHVNGWNCGPA